MNFLCYSSGIAFVILMFANCQAKKEDNKFYYTAKHALYFKHPESDSTSQILSIKPQTDFKEDSVIPIEIVYSWRSRIIKLKELKDMRIRFIYTDTENKKTESAAEPVNFQIYEDIPNRPYEIVRVPLAKNGEWLCAMFDSLSTKFDEGKYLNFECTNSFKPSAYPQEVEVEITLIWKDGEQTYKTKLNKAQHSTYKTRSRLYG